VFEGLYPFGLDELRGDSVRGQHSGPTPHSPGETDLDLCGSVIFQAMSTTCRRGTGRWARTAGSAQATA
jgi:hypothetical protein